MTNLPQSRPGYSLHGRSHAIDLPGWRIALMGIGLSSCLSISTAACQDPIPKPTVLQNPPGRDALPKSRQEVIDEAKRDERERMKRLVHAALQKELSTVGRLVSFKQVDALELLGVIEKEWIEKLVDPLVVNTFRSRSPVRETLLENAMMGWLGHCKTPDEVALYATEVGLRAQFRIKVLQNELLELMQQRFALTENQVDEFRKRLVLMQPNGDRELAIRQLTESAQHRLVAPLINGAYGEGLISNYQRNAVARFEHGTVQATYPVIIASQKTAVEVTPEFFLNGFTLRENDSITVQQVLLKDDPNKPPIAQSSPVRTVPFKLLGPPAGPIVNRALPEIQANSIHGRLSKLELEEMLYGVVGGSRQAFQLRRKDDILRQVDRIHRICELTSDQRDKIDQAIDIEIERNNSDIASLLSEIDDGSAPELKQQVYKNAHQMLTRMQQERYFEQDSLWEKVVHSNLDDTQTAKLRDEEEKAENRRQSLAKEKVVLICQQGLGLTELERQQLLNFLNLPSNGGLNSVEATREALSLLSLEKRREVLPDSLWEQWQ